jgi:hypothetical protein
MLPPAFANERSGNRGQRATNARVGARISKPHIDSDPRATTDAYLNEEGKVVNILADPAHHTAEDPINLKVFGRKGEPIQSALISDDDFLMATIRALSYRLCPSQSKRPRDRAS